MLCASKQTVFRLAILLSKTLCFAKVIESFHAQQVQKLLNFILFMPLNSEIVAFIFIMIFLFFQCEIFSRFSFDYFVVFKSSLFINSTPFTLCIHWRSFGQNRKKTETTRKKGNRYMQRERETSTKLRRKMWRKTNEQSEKSSNKIFV